MKKIAKFGMLMVVLATTFGVTTLFAACGPSKEVESLNAQIETLSAEKDQLQTQNEQLQANNEQLQTQNEQLQANNEQLQTQNEQLQTQNEQLQTDNETKAGQIETLSGQLDNIESLNKEVNKSFKELFYDAGQLEYAYGNNHDDINKLVDIAKTLYVALNKQEVNFCEAYKITVTTDSTPVELIFRLDYKDGKYQIYFISDNGNGPTADLYEIQYNNGKVTWFSRYKGVNGDGKKTIESDTITNHVISGVIPSMFAQKSYDANEEYQKLNVTLSTDHQITITQAEKDALYV